MTTSFVAMGVAITAVIGLVVGLYALNLLVGSVETYFGKPKLTFLNSKAGADGLAFGFRWNGAKEPARINTIKVRLFNPFGNPTQVEVSKQFDNHDSSFAEDLSMGPGFKKFLGAKGFEDARVQVEVSSTRDGVSFFFEMKGLKFKNLISIANTTKEGFISKYRLDDLSVAKPPIEIPERTFIAPSAPGRGPQLKIATNPIYAAEFAAATTGDAGGETAAVANFLIAKVWIEPGCIVCNACEDIIKEVFEVKADTCIIRPNAPLDDGLRIVEAAEACPVEVIKFVKA